MLACLHVEHRKLLKLKSHEELTIGRGSIILNGTVSLYVSRKHFKIILRGTAGDWFVVLRTCGTYPVHVKIGDEPVEVCVRGKAYVLNLGDTFWLIKDTRKGLLCPFRVVRECNYNNKRKAIDSEKDNTHLDGPALKKRNPGVICTTQLPISSNKLSSATESNCIEESKRSEPHPEDCFQPTASSEVGKIKLQSGARKRSECGASSKLTECNKIKSPSSSDLLKKDLGNGSKSQPKLQSACDSKVTIKKKPHAISDKSKARKPRKPRARKIDAEKRPPQPSFFSKKQNSSSSKTLIGLSCLHPKPARKPVALLEMDDEPSRLENSVRRYDRNGSVDDPLMEDIDDKETQPRAVDRIIAKLAAKREAQKVLTDEDHNILESQVEHFDSLPTAEYAAEELKLKCSQPEFNSPPPRKDKKNKKPLGFLLPELWHDSSDEENDFSPNSVRRFSKPKMSLEMYNKSKMVTSANTEDDEGESVLVRLPSFQFCSPPEVSPSPFSAVDIVSSLEDEFEPAIKSLSPLIKPLPPLKHIIKPIQNVPKFPNHSPKPKASSFTVFHSDSDKKCAQTDSSKHVANKNQLPPLPPTLDDTVLSIESSFDLSD